MPLHKYQQYAVAILPIVLVGIIIYFFTDIVTYIVLAWTLSMVGAPINNFLRRWIKPSSAAILTILTFAFSLLLILYLFIPPIVQQARNFAQVDYSKVISNLEEPINDWNQWLLNRGLLQESQTEEAELITPSPDTPKSHIKVLSLDSLLHTHDSLRSAIQIIIQIPRVDPAGTKEIQPSFIDETFFERVKRNLLEVFNPNQIPRLFGSIVGALGNVLVTIMSIFFIAFFFLKEQGLFTKMVESLVPDGSEEQWLRALDETAKMLRRYFSGVVLQMIAITILVSITLKLLGFEYALLIGFFAALMNVIPYLGPILGGIFGIVLTVSSSLDVDFYSDTLPKLGIIIIVFAAMQFLDNFIIQPNIFSKSVKAHPLEIFLVVLIGAKVGGILGMIIAIPMYTVLRVLAKVFLSEFKLVQRITQDL